MSARILVVEDEAIIARDIQTTLESLGYEVPAVVASGAAALAAVDESRFDLVLMDVRIQGDLDGIDTAIRIGESHHVPIVYLTSFSDDATLARASAAGAYGYLLKPFNDRDLRTAVEVALQKHALEDRLAERERWFSTTLKSIGDAVIATDVAQNITFMNAVAERVTGFSASEAAGRKLREVLRLVDASNGGPIESPLSRAFQDGFAVELPRGVALTMKEGGRRAVGDSAAPIRDERGNLLGGVVVFRDITDRVELEERLAHSEKLAAMGTLAAGMAHEINNPLAYVMGNLVYALETLADLEPGLSESSARPALVDRVRELREALGEAHEGSQRIHNIVNDLKRFGRLESSDLGVLELADVLETSMRMTQNLVRHCAKVSRAYQTIPFVEGNASQLSQVFINLLINATQAIGDDAEDGRIVVATFTDAAGRAVVEISDNGPGVPAEAQRRVFDPFFTTKPVGVGTGLGLSICHSIVKAHGGEIWLESKVGEGATFRVALPAARRSELAGGPPTTGKASRGRVMVIDDEPAVARVIARLLRADHDVFVFGDAREALSRIASGENFDVIFCDLMMPNVTGIDLYETLRTTRPDLARRVVFMTGGATAPATQTFLDASANTILWKPIEAEVVRRTAREYVDASRRQT